MDTEIAHQRARRPFAIVAASRLPRQLPLILPVGFSPGRRSPSTTRPRCSPPPAAPPPPRRPVGSPTVDEIVAAMRVSLGAQEEAPATLPAPPQELWLSPTKMGLRYGEVCIARTPAGTSALVRISSYRAPADRSPGKRPYRRWHGIDLLAFLTSGARREVRIAQVLKGSRC